MEGTSMTIPFHSRLLICFFSFFLFYSLGCNNDQQGGWKSKGGSRTPVPPSFSEEITPFSTPESMVIQGRYISTASDLLICESSTQTKEHQLHVSYDIIGTMLGFDLFDARKQDDYTITTLKDLELDTETPLTSLNIIDIESSEVFLVDLLDGLLLHAPVFTENLNNILNSILVRKNALIPELMDYKIADDGRKCFTATIVSPNYENQNFEILNDEIFNNLTKQDQSLLMLYTALYVYARNYGAINLNDLKNFVFYTHTQEFQDIISETSSETTNQITKLIQTFLPDYEQQ